MDEQRRELTNAQVVAGAGALAAALAGLVVGLSRRQAPPTPASQAPSDRAEPVAEVEPRRPDSRRRATAVEEIAPIESRARDVVAAGRRAGGRLAVAVDTRALSDAGAAVSTRVDRLARRAREVADLGEQKGHEVARKARTGAQRVGDQTTSTGQEIAAQAAAAAVAGAGRARDIGVSIADAAKERVPQVTHKVSDEVMTTLRDKVGDDIVPQVREIALQAASTALELWQSARERAAEVARTDLKAPAAQAVHTVEVGGERAREASAALAEKAAELGERAKGASRRTAEATVDTGKDTGALLFWAGAAAGLVFYALLSAERREQVTRSAQVIAGQVQELIRDFQGYDDEF